MFYSSDRNAIMCVYIYSIYNVLTKIFFFQNVAVVELSDSDTDEELLTSEDDSESDEDDSVTDEVTIDNIKFPKQKGEKGKIEILDSKANE